MKAILTKVLPATSTKPTRLKAYDADGNSVIVREWGNVSLSSEAAHRSAAKKLALKMGWAGELCSGWTGEGYAHCFRS